MKRVRLIRHAERPQVRVSAILIALVSSFDSCDRFITGQREKSACHTI